MDCRNCDKACKVDDGYFMCNNDGLPVMVISNNKPTKNYLQCEKEKNNGTRIDDKKST